MKWLKEEKLRKGWERVPDWAFCNEDGRFP